jgi:hemolysin activation/secretion protein
MQTHCPYASRLLIALLSVLVTQAGAQVSTSPVQADALKSIEQSLQQSQPRRLKPLSPLDVMGLESNQSIDKLVGVEVDHADYREPVLRYWREQMGQAISATQLQDFRGWLYGHSRWRGFLSYAQTEVRAVAGGSVLVVQIVEPRLQAVRVNATSDETMKRYGALVIERLNQDFKQGATLDILGLDQRLLTASEDLPLDLEATLRAVGPNEVDMIVQIRDVSHQTGQARERLVQLNNHGLRQYGRPQVLASMVLDGLDPRSSLSLIALKSEGITFGRAEYSAARYANRQRWSVWASGSNSRNILGGSATTLGRSGEVGVGIGQLYGGWRDFVYRWRPELFTRHSSSALELTGQEITRVHDTQYRLRISADNEKTTEASSRADFTFAIGDYSRLDGITSVDKGPYGKIEWSLRHQKALDLQRQWTGAIKLRGQLSHDRLDSYNQMTLGGPSGVRAFTTVDGLGDQGLLLSLELNRRLALGQSVGLFYDGGQIKLRNPQASEPKKTYSLQALGTQINGEAVGGIYNLTLAKGIGSYHGWSSSNIESKPRNWRLYGSISWMFQ